MEIRLYRDQPIQREARMLPAATYNLARTLLGRSPHGAVFVPIRSIQYLAVLDSEEFVFVDSQYKSRVEIAWQAFRPQVRQALDDPVPFEVLVYHADGLNSLLRLLGEFPRALQDAAAKVPRTPPAKVLKFERR